MYVIVADFDKDQHIACTESLDVVHEFVQALVDIDDYTAVPDPGNNDDQGLFIIYSGNYIGYVRYTCVVPMTSESLKEAVDDGEDTSS